MCARLSRCFQALDNMAMRKRNGQKDPPLHIEEADDIVASVEQHWALCTMTSSNGTAQLANPDMTDEPLDLNEIELIYVLIQTEKFMYSSVKLLGTLRAIEPDTRFFTSIPDTALRWVCKAEELLNTFRHRLNPDSPGYQVIARQKLKLTPALDKFLQLLSAVQVSRSIWLKKATRLWAWPQLECLDEPFEAPSCCLYIDLVIGLEEVQKMLRSQDASRDRGKRSNLASARKVVAQAFERSSKVLAIRIDLGKGTFRNIAALTDDLIEAETQADLVWIKKCFAAFMRHVNKVFGHARLGYMAKLEFGAQKGFHYHLIILLNGQKHQQDVNIAMQLGEHWAKVIAAGQGVYYNCNAIKHRYKYKGIGMIHRSDSAMREIFETKVVTYLVKHDLPFELLKDEKRRFSRSTC